MTHKRAILTLCTLCALSACKRGADRFSSTDETLRLGSADQAMQAKLQQLIPCMNRTLLPFEREARNYRDDVVALSTHRPGTSWYRAWGGPFFNPSGYSGTEPGLESCLADLDKAANMKPAIADIDQPARIVIANFRSLITPGEQFDSYLSQKDYQDDSFRKGHQLDLTIEPLLASLLPAAAQLEDAIARESTALQQHEVDAIDRKEGHSLHWHTQQTMLAARQMNDAIQAMAEQGKLTAQAVQAATQPLQIAYDDTIAYAAAHPDIEQRQRNPPVWFFIHGAAEMQVTAGKDLRRELETPPSLSHNDPEFAREQLNIHLRNVSTTFNMLVDAYNTHAANGAPEN